jgi:hypothetical protein
VTEETRADGKPKKTSVANDESKRWRGGRGSAERMEERMDAAYCYILEGGTRRQVVAKLVTRFNISKITAYEDYKRAMGTLQTEQVATKQDLLNQIQALRLVTIQKALKRGQLQTVATLLKDLGAVVGEVAPEQLAAQAPQLNLVIEPPALSNSEPAQLSAAEVEIVEPVDIDAEPAG